MIANIDLILFRVKIISIICISTIIVLFLQLKFKYMKKLSILALLLSTFILKSQDTLFMKGTGRAIPCEINKILSGSIFYSIKSGSRKIEMSEVAKYSLGKTQFVDGSMIRDFDGTPVKQNPIVRCSYALNGNRCTENTNNASGKCNKHK